MPTSHPDGLAPASDDRRRFLRFLGAGTLAVGAAGTLAACDSADPNFDTPAPLPPVQPPAPPAVTFNFANDLGPLNYAYALEQLEGAFYAMVIGMSNFETLFTDPNERRLLRDIAGHEGVHRDFLAAAISFTGASNLIPNLTLNPAALAGLTTRQAILTQALIFEDLGVAAYNGAGRYIANDSYLTIAGKIVSVEARHAAAIATALNGSSDAPRLGAADVIDENGLDRAFAPNTVLNAAQAFVLNPLSATNF